MASGTQSKSTDWREIVAKKQQDQAKQIPTAWRIDASKYEDVRNVMDVPSFCGILSDGELAITNDNDAVDIIDKIHDNVFSVEEVVTAFCKRAAVAHQLTTCLTEMFFEDAIIKAQRMDKQRKASPDDSLPPLFGLPISLKDSFKVPGYDTTIGFVSLVGKPADSYSALAQLLMDLGAVLYCKTNVPQSLMTADSHNNVFGRCLNPRNKALTAGGSSGGEGVLVAMRGSVLGIGTDIAGSIRIPALCNGVYGFKPTTAIVPYAGQQPAATPGGPGIVPCAGPIATSARACAYFMQVLIKAKPWTYDASCQNLHWLEPSPPLPEVLRVGYIEDDGVFTPTPPIRRAIRVTKEKLAAAGHEIVLIRLTGVSEIALEDVWNIFALDAMKMTKALMEASGEPPVPSMHAIGLIGKSALSLPEFMELNFKRTLNKQRFAQIWVQNNLDVILTPAAAHTAPPLDTFKHVSYTVLYNYLDWPGVVLPVGKVSAEHDGLDGAAKYGAVDEAMYATYTGPEDYADAPISIQLVGRPQEDQLLAQQAVVIDGILKAST